MAQMGVAPPRPSAYKAVETPHSCPLDAAAYTDVFLFFSFVGVLTCSMLMTSLHPKADLKAGLKSAGAGGGAAVGGKKPLSNAGIAGLKAGLKSSSAGGGQGKGGGSSGGGGKDGGAGGIAAARAGLKSTKPEAPPSAATGSIAAARAGLKSTGDAAGGSKKKKQQKKGSTKKEKDTDGSPSKKKWSWKKK